MTTLGTSAVADRIKVATATTGTGTLTLGTTVYGFRSFATAFPIDKWYVPYAILGDGQWETGYGSYDADFPTLFVREYVVASSNANALVSLAAGNKTLIVSAHAHATNLLAAKSYVSETDDPNGATNDRTQGFNQGSLWVNRASGAVWYCTSANTAGAAVWALLCGSASELRRANAQGTTLSTTNATATNFVAAITVSAAPLTASCIRHRTVYVYANEIATGDAACWRIEMAVAIDAGYGFVGTPEVTKFSADAGAAAWAATVQIVSSQVYVRVTGEAAKTIKWATKVVHAFDIELG